MSLRISKLRTDHSQSFQIAIKFCFKAEDINLKIILTVCTHYPNYKFSVRIIRTSSL